MLIRVMLSEAKHLKFWFRAAWQNSEILRFAQNDNSVNVSTLQRDFNFRPACAECHV
jgi:hypothetical protein